MTDATYNALTIKIYAGLSVTIRPDPAELLAGAQDIKISTIFPYGLYGPASFVVPTDDITRKYSWVGGDRVVIENSQTIVWEGWLGDIELITDANRSAFVVNCDGQWGANLGRQTLSKPWADNRLSMWKPSEADQFKQFNTYDRNNALLAMPIDGVEYISGHQVVMGTYSAPTGETVKRLTFDYDFSETALWPVFRAKHNDAPLGANTFTDLDNAIDDDDTTYSTVTITSDDYIYIGMTEPFTNGNMFLKVNMGAVVNANAATLSCTYSKLDSNTHGDDAWVTLSIVDGTASGGATFAQDGNISFTVPPKWGKRTVDSNSAYWLRLQPSANLTASIRFISLEWGQSQAWKLALYNSTAAGDDWSVTSDGSGSVDETLGTADSDPYFYFASQARQEGVANGSVRGEISNLIVYTETGSITVSAVVLDVHGYVNFINSDTSNISTANTLSIEPFITEGPGGHETLSSILERAVGYGDSSQNSWNVYLKHSETALSPSGRPVLALEQYPALSDFDYAITIDEENLDGSFNVVQDNGRIANWIVVVYQDIVSGETLSITPDDNSSLQDADSIVAYRYRYYVLDVGTADSTTAVGFGRRYLSEYKDPKFYVSGPIVVKGYIRAKNGQAVPAANIVAGKRLRIENFLHDLTPTDDAGLTAIITETNYNDSNQTCSISLGLQDDAGVLIGRLFKGLNLGNVAT